ncbi:unnamed protein product [Protopolystoma xenopodis]|uniref:RRM domain-containing protein n=1 Tax=Protopolystoma xenopodis TaxID=117903 RepID=A0A3S5BKN8_9PLAT|nr:unnamed protein product [Protopolystoma xenopodis]
MPPSEGSGPGPMMSNRSGRYPGGPDSYPYYDDVPPYRGGPHMSGYSYHNDGGYSGSRYMSGGSVGGRPGPYSRPCVPGAVYGGRSESGRNYPPGGWNIGHPSEGGGYESNWQSSTGHSVRMRGLPYSATMDDVTAFLAPLQPVNIHMRLNPVCLCFLLKFYLIY